MPVRMLLALGAVFQFKSLGGVASGCAQGSVE